MTFPVNPRTLTNGVRPGDKLVCLHCAYPLGRKVVVLGVTPERRKS